MVDKYDEIYQAYKNFIENESQYDVRVVKYNTNTSSYFPVITFVLSNNTDTDYCTNDKIEYYEANYFTIDIYTKDKTIGANKVASQVISNELSQLTMQFFGEKLNMKRTLNRPTPNLDTSILRRTIKYQCLIGNARANIIRR